MARDGSIGRETFEQVEALVKQGRSKADAFKQIASDTGRNAGTVSANYYRVARATGAVKPRKVRAKAVPARRSRKPAVARSAADGDIESTANEIIRNLNALVAAVKAQDAEVKALKRHLADALSL